MGFWSNLWEGIKAPFKYAYDKVVNPVVNTISNVYDKVKGFIPAPLRAIGDTIQGTAKQIQSGIETARNVAGAVGLKMGGVVPYGRPQDQGMFGEEPYGGGMLLKKHYMA
jgi:phage-related protein